MKTFKQFTISTKPFDIDIVSGILWQLDIDGINEYDDYLNIFVNESKSVSRNDIEKALTKLIEQDLITSFNIEENSFEDKNWNEEYEKNVRVIEVSDKLVIRPSFKDYSSNPGQIIITIDPKMSFGTGEHATTKLVLQMIEKYTPASGKVLDVGSGTGVLAIASVMLGAEKAIGIDNDEWCLLNGNENVKANSLENKVEIRLCELHQVEETNFDLIVANINKHILIELPEILKQKLNSSGRLILSGLLNVDEKDITEKYSSFGFKLLDKSAMDEWISLVFTVN